MTVFTTQLLGSEPVAEGTQAFHLARPEGFVYQPGQSIDLVLADAAPDTPAGDVSHTFSLVSAPHEATLTVATRMRDSAYKNTLKALPTGTTLRFEGPYGDALVPDSSQRPLMLIAGGIGITPFISILRDMAEHRQQRPVRLLYSNRRPEDTAFLAELQQLEQTLAQFKLIATMTNMGASSQPWDGPTGYLNAQRITQYSQGLSDPLYFLSGPPALVEAMYDALEDADVNEEDIHSESFSGY